MIVEVLPGRALFQPCPIVSGMSIGNLLVAQVQGLRGSRVRVRVMKTLTKT